jgi:hypothetical protein
MDLSYPSPFVFGANPHDSMGSLQYQLEVVMPPASNEDAFNQVLESKVIIFHYLNCRASLFL